MRLFCVKSLALCALLFAGVFAQEVDNEAEIRRMRRELMQVQEERSRVREDWEKDRTDFEDYRKRTLARLRKMRVETDSVRQEVVVLRAGLDSLQARVNAERSREKELGMRQENLRHVLGTVTRELITVAQSFPPGSIDRVTGALTLLRDELETKSVDNSEALNRMFQITRDMHELGTAIQIVQGASPIPEIRGTTYRIRLGHFFEAVVNAQGTQAAVWTGNDDNGQPLWRQMDDPVLSQQILKAVNVREGKALPSLVSLPFSHVAVVKGE